MSDYEEQNTSAVDREKAAQTLGMDVSGFTDSEIQELLAESEATEAGGDEKEEETPGQEEPEQAPEVPVVAEESVPDEPIQESTLDVPEAAAIEEAAEVLPVVNNNPKMVYPKMLPESLRGAYEAMSMTYRFSANTVCAYIDAMGSHSFISETGGAAQQKLLFSAVANLLNAPEAEFRKNIQFLFPIFTMHLKGVFSETNIHRFAQFIDLSAQDAKAMPFLFELLRMIADPKSRATTVKHNLGHMPKNLERASSGRGLSEQGRVNLLHFLEL